MGVSDFLVKSITKVYGSTLLVFRGGGWGSHFQEKNITLHFNCPEAAWRLDIFSCSNRFDYMSLARRLTGIVSGEGSGESHGKEEEEEMEVEVRLKKPGKRYKDQVRLLILIFIYIYLY